MKKFLLPSILVLTAALGLLESAGSQVTGDNGVLGYNLNDYGRFRVSLTPYSTGSREVDRMSFIAALDQNNVFDYAEDANLTSILAQSVNIPGVDEAFTCVSDNSFTNRPPKIRVRHTVYAWQNTSFVIIGYKVINDSSATVGLYFAAAVLTRPSGTYGGERLDYNADKQTAYYFRAGQKPHWGIRLLNKDAYSVKLRDWDEYSSNPNADEATDATRYAMTATAGFDSGLVVGPNSGIFHVNAGLHTLTPGDSAEVFYAVAYGDTLPAMLAASDAAKAQYDAILSAIEEFPSGAPTTFALHQNFPNPFNPSTNIRFELARRGNVRLTIYDTMGREVKTLVNGVMAPGAHVISFEASGLASGVYLYMLKTDGFNATRKMLLMR